jgi:hypothetical protein
VLALERPHLEELRTQRRRDGHLDGDAFDAGKRLHRSLNVGCRVEEQARSRLVLGRIRLDELGGLGAQEDFAGLGRRLHLDGSARGRSCDQQFAVRVADEEELEAAAVEAGVHLQLNRARRRPRPPDRPQRPAHLESCPCRPRCVIIALVQQQQRVSPELEQPASLCVGDGQ